MQRLLPMLAFGLMLFGCSPAPTVAPTVPQLVVEPPAGVPKSEAPSPAPAVPTLPFRFANDTGGKIVEKSLAPRMAGLPTTRVPSATARTSDIESGDLPAAKPTATAVPLPATLRKTALPPPPKEGVPAELGNGNELDFRDRKLPEGPTVQAPPRPQPTAADVPRLGTQLPDRASTEDPTIELSTMRIVQTLMAAPAMAAPFLRLILPDPFEFAGHLQATTAAEFATSPAFVPSAKP